MCFRFWLRKKTGRGIRHRYRNVFRTSRGGTRRSRFGVVRFRSGFAPFRFEQCFARGATFCRKNSKNTFFIIGWRLLSNFYVVNLKKNVFLLFFRQKVAPRAKHCSKRKGAKPLLNRTTPNRLRRVPPRDVRKTFRYRWRIPLPVFFLSQKRKHISHVKARSGQMDHSGRK
jgi:hypothetical protein